MMNQVHYRLNVTLTSPLLATLGDLKTMAEFVAGPRGAEISPEEAALYPAEAAPDEETARGMTVFPRFNGHPVVLAYQVLGALKSAGSANNGMLTPPGGRKPIAGLKKKVDDYIRISPMWAEIKPPENPAKWASTNDFYSQFTQEINGTLAYLRPLRAQNGMYERVVIAASEFMPAGHTFSIGITVIQPDRCGITREILETLLDFVSVSGFLQARKMGFGQWAYELLTED